MPETVTVRALAARMLDVELVSALCRLKDKRLLTDFQMAMVREAERRRLNV